MAQAACRMLTPTGALPASVTAVFINNIDGVCVRRQGQKHREECLQKVASGDFKTTKKKHGKAISQQKIENLLVDCAQTNEGSCHLNSVNDHRGQKSSVGSGQSSTNGGKQLWSVESDGVDSIQLLEGGNQDCSSLHSTSHCQHMHR